ncbi:MAG: hypothetical protein R2734_10385 [Nocardioides sp.]
MAVGTVAMMLYRRDADAADRSGDRRWSACSSSLPSSPLNLVYQRLSSPLMTRAQGLRAELSEIAHESS